MNAEQIQQMRTLLAAQPATTETRTPGLHHKLKTMLARKSTSWTTEPFATPAAPDKALTAPEADFQDPADPILGDPILGDPIPPELLLGGLAPRRPAFGQRVEPVLELKLPVLTESRRLILCAAGGEAVGEIILHAGGAALHAEAPFFPEDLADEAFPRPKPNSDKPPAQSAAPPAPELAATFLLANLAARLASEEAALSRRLVMAQSLSQAA